jgi:hypothetical protein
MVDDQAGAKGGGGTRVIGRGGPKADVVVFRDPVTNVAYARPGVVILDGATDQHKLRIRNYTREAVEVEFPGCRGSLDAHGQKGAKLEFDLSHLPVGVHPYRLRVGDDDAQGNSSPAVIIDE